MASVANHIGPSGFQWTKNCNTVLIPYNVVLPWLPSNKKKGILQSCSTILYRLITCSKQAIPFKKWDSINCNNRNHMLTMRSSPPRPTSPINAIPLGIGYSKKLKTTRSIWFSYQEKWGVNDASSWWG